MAFVKGQSGNPKGKPRGATGLISRTVKDVILEAFNKLQEHPSSNILSWAEKNPKDFYQVAAKLIPTEIKGTIETTTKQVFKIGDTTIEF